jgi:alkylhydroperoxidase family enzyme
VDINSLRGVKTGQAVEKVFAIEDWRDREEFSPRERLALEYAERVTYTDQDVTDEFFEQLKKEFDESALVQMTASICMENFRSKFNVSFRIESNGLCPLPVKD